MNTLRQTKQKKINEKWPVHKMYNTNIKVAQFLYQYNTTYTMIVAPSVFGPKLSCGQK